MNFHTYLNGSGASSPMNASVWERLFNPNTGPLTTRFAAVFVCVAGIAVALMERSWAGTSRALSARLLRRGFVLYAAGFALEWIWPGTIIFYYGAYFMLAAILIHLSSRQLLALCVPIALVAALIQGVRAERLADGDFTSWLDPVSITSLTDLMVRTFVSYTHPVFPWLVFLCIGIVVGRNIDTLSRHRLRLLVLGASLVTVAYVARDLVNHLAATADNAAFMLMVSSTDPKSGGVTYTVGTVGSTLVCIVLISHLCDRWQRSSIITALARIGRTSLTFYMFHCLLLRNSGGDVRGCVCHRSRHCTGAFNRMHRAWLDVRVVVDQVHRTRPVRAPLPTARALIHCRASVRTINFD